MEDKEQKINELDKKFQETSKKYENNKFNSIRNGRKWQNYFC